MKHFTTITLPVQARCTYKGRPEDKPRSVILRPGQLGPVLQIEGTPGSWYVTTLCDNPDDRLSIDAGQDWTLVNRGEVLRSATVKLCELLTAFLP